MPFTGDVGDSDAIRYSASSLHSLASLPLTEQTAGCIICISILTTLSELSRPIGGGFSTIFTNCRCDTPFAEMRYLRFRRAALASTMRSQRELLRTRPTSSRWRNCFAAKEKTFFSLNAAHRLLVAFCFGLFDCFRRQRLFSADELSFCRR